MNYSQPTSGYVAFISILIVSTLLLTTTLSLAQLSISQRLFVLSLERKKVSESLATACAEVARIYVYTDHRAALASFPMTFPVADAQCTLLKVTPGGSSSVITTQAQQVGSVTTLEIIVDTNSGKLLSWHEL